MVTKPHGQPLPSHPRHHRDVWAPLVLNVLLPNLAQPFVVPPAYCSLSSPKSSSLPCSPTFFHAETNGNWEKQSSFVGASLERLNFTPNIPDKEGWAPGTGRDERECRNGRVGLLSFGLVPISLPCAHPGAVSCWMGTATGSAAQRDQPGKASPARLLLLPVLQTINSRDPPSHCSALLRGARFS